MDTVNTYLGPNAMDAATLTVGFVFLTLFIIAAMLLARHHLGIVTAIAGASVWVVTGLLLAHEQALLGRLAVLMGGSGKGINLALVQRAHAMAPLVFALGVVIAVVVAIIHRVENAMAPTYEPLEDQHDLDGHYHDMGHTT